MDAQSIAVIVFMALFILVGIYGIVKSEQFHKEEMKNEESNKKNKNM